MPTHWFDVFTEETWREAMAVDLTVTGFSRSKHTEVLKVAPGDLFICYLKAPLMLLVGILECTGTPYLADMPRLWQHHDFPSRVPVKPLVALGPPIAPSMRDLIRTLSFYDPLNAPRTWAKLQGSPTRLASADGEQLVAAIRQAAGQAASVTPGLPADRDRITNDQPPTARPPDRSGMRGPNPAIERRRGNPRLRAALLQAYAGRCAFSGCPVEPVLDAVIIHPRGSPDTDDPTKALLLRTDLHTLFEFGLVWVETEDMTIIVAEAIQGSAYGELHGRPIRLPRDATATPSRRALDQHRAWAGG